MSEYMKDDSKDDFLCAEVLVRYFSINERQTIVHYNVIYEIKNRNLSCVHFAALPCNYKSLQMLSY